MDPLKKLSPASKARVTTLMRATVANVKELVSIVDAEISPQELETLDPMAAMFIGQLRMFATAMSNIPAPVGPESEGEASEQWPESL